MIQDTSKLHLDILDKTRQDLLSKVTPHVSGYILGGGTALSLQIRHRKSFDFDFFYDQPIPKNLLGKLSHVLEVAEVVVDSADELTFFDSHRVKFTFLSYPFPPYLPVIITAEGLTYFPVQDIAVQKAYTIGRRGVYRDYFDLFTILSGEIMRMREIILGAEKVYGNVFNSKLFLEQLVYFKDLPDFDIEPLENHKIPSPEDVKKYFSEAVEDYLKLKS